MVDPLLWFSGVPHNRRVWSPLWNKTKRRPDASSKTCETPPVIHCEPLTSLKKLLRVFRSKLSSAAPGSKFSAPGRISNIPRSLLVDARTKLVSRRSREGEVLPKGACARTSNEIPPNGSKIRFAQIEQKQILTFQRQIGLRRARWTPNETGAPP